MSSEYLRKIDALVAERIMGLVPQVDFGQWDEHEWQRDEDGEIDEFGFESGYHNGPVCVRCGYSYCVHCRRRDGGELEPCIVEPPRYSSSIAAAWQVVEKMRRSGWDYFSLVQGHKDTWDCMFMQWSGPDDAISQEIADTAPLAICLAALRTVGVEVPGGD